MGKDITDKKDKKERKEKKEKKEKRASLDGVTKVKKDKKDKKDKKKRESNVNADVAGALEAQLQNEDATMIDAAEDTVMDGGEDEVVITGALVPFALPLAEDAKEVKKILKTVKKCEFVPGFVPSFF
jgi:H/ACA ribonucleoprotein complex subunit 2